MSAIVVGHFHIAESAFAPEEAPAVLEDPDRAPVNRIPLESDGHHAVPPGRDVEDDGTLVDDRVLELIIRAPGQQLQVRNPHDLVR